MSGGRKTRSGWHKNKKMSEFEYRPLSQRIARGSIPLLIIVIMLYAVAHLICRTPGFRVIVTDALGKRIGVPVEIDDFKLKWNLDMRIQGLRSEGGVSEGRSGFEVQELIVEWSLVSGLRGESHWLSALSAKGLRLSLALDDAGGWEPRAFAPLSAWLSQWGGFDLEPVEKSAVPQKAGSGAAKTGETEKKAPGLLWEKLHLVIEDGEISWWGGDGEQMAGITGIDLLFTPVNLPQRELHHYRADIARVWTARDRELENLSVELLRTQGRDMVLGFHADWPSRRAATQKESAAEREPEVEEIIAEPISRQQFTAVRSDGFSRSEECDVDELAAHIREMLEETLEEDVRAGD